MKKAKVTRRACVPAICIVTQIMGFGNFSPPPSRFLLDNRPRKLYTTAGEACRNATFPGSDPRGIPQRKQLVRRLALIVPRVKKGRLFWCYVAGTRTANVPEGKLSRCRSCCMPWTLPPFSSVSSIQMSAQSTSVYALSPVIPPPPTSMCIALAWRKPKNQLQAKAYVISGRRVHENTRLSAANVHAPGKVLKKLLMGAAHKR